MALAAKVRDGWLEIPCDANDTAQVYIAASPLGVTEPNEWLDAFRGWNEVGQRVAKIRPPTHGSCLVWLKVDGNAVRLSRPVTL